MAGFDIGQWRIHNQRLAPATFEHPADVVRWMGAMQAQDYGQAIWGIGARLHPAMATRQTVEQAIADGQIIRTWPMRGTIHFVPAEDAQWMLQLGATKMIAKDKRRLEELELNESIIERAKAIFTDVLDDGKPLSREKLMQALEERGIQTQGGRGYHILWHAAQVGLICIGPTEDKEQTFVLLEKWVPQSHRLARDEALVELARRYFTSHGPATVHDFAWWTGLTVTEAKAGLEGAKTDLIVEKIDQKDYWMSSAMPTPQASEMRLLCGFDEYLLGYQKREAVLDPTQAHKVCPGANGIFFPMVVQNGHIIGVWKRTIKKDKVVITCDPFTPFTPAQDEAFATIAQRYGAFLGLSVVFG